MVESDLSQREYEILHHAIGAPQHQDACDDPYRNYFYTYADDTDCVALKGRGLVAMAPERDGMAYFSVTPEGVELVRQRLPKLRRWVVEYRNPEHGYETVYAETRSKARAARVMDIQEAWGDCSWLEAVRAIRSVRLA